MADVQVPFQRSYWVVPGKLLAGCYPGGKTSSEEEAKLTGLVKCGIQHLINLMEPDESDHSGSPFVAYDEKLKDIARQQGIEVTCARIPIKDLTAPTERVMKKILAEIDESMAQNKPVYVHCWGGKGRTGAVVGCYLMSHRLATSASVLRKIAELRKNEPTGHLASPETPEQVRMVLSWRTEC
jgi:predicted protein tyrosine phosphatase